MSQINQLKSELSHLHQTMEKIDELFNKGQQDENNDLVIPESAATTIKVLLEDL